MALILAFILLSGCISQKEYASDVLEKISSNQSYDLDKDGIPDLMIYDYSPITKGNVSLKRQVAVVTRTYSKYSSFNNLTSFQLIETKAKLDELDSRIKPSLQSCAASAGLKQDCTQLSACTSLCSGSSKCKRAIDKYQSVVPASMIKFVDDRNVIDGMLLDTRKMLPGLEGAPVEAKNEYLMRLKGVVVKFAELYSNPLYTRSEIALCSMDNIDLNAIADAADDIGSYNTSVDGYIYYITLSAKPGDAKAVSGVTLKDSVPSSALSNIDEINSGQNIDLSENGTAYTISWVSDKTSTEGYMVGYRFMSAKGPDEVLASLSAPSLKVSGLDIGFLAATDSMFGIMYAIAGNFFFALGSAISLTLIMLLLLYNLASIVFNSAKAVLAKEKLLNGVRKAFTGTEMRWKSDLIIGILLLAAGSYISYFVMPATSAQTTLIGAVEYFTDLALSVTSAAGLAAAGCVFLGMLLVYTAVENMAKIMILEQVYGIGIREEHDLFRARVGRLKEKITELQKMVEQYSAEEFEVSDEYDIVSSVSIPRIDELSKKMTPESRSAIENQLESVEAALERLSERKRTADENWQKWYDTIDKMLTEQNEVYLTSLITIPASLRTWALRRYAKEKGAEGVVFERDSLKRKLVTPDLLLRALFEQKLVKGGVMMQEDKVIAAQMEEGSATVPSALALKTRNSLRSLAKAVGQHEPGSFASIGEKNVLVMMKASGIEAMLIIPREKFKEAVEEFKKRAKMISGA